MALVEKNVKTQEQVLRQSSFQRLSDWAEKNSKLVMFLSALLVVVTVLIVFYTVSRNSLRQQGRFEMDQAIDSKELEELRKKYSDFRDLDAQILYRLANRYQEEAGIISKSVPESKELLDKAITAYLDWQKEYDTKKERDPLAEEVIKALESARSNRTFLEERHAAYEKANTLITHPIHSATVKEFKNRFGPTLSPRPEVILEFEGGGKVTFELFQAETPETVANFIKLCGEKYFEGMLFQASGTSHAAMVPREEGAKTDLIAFEESPRETEPGQLAMVRSDEAGKNKSAEFVVLYAKDARFEGATIFGQAKPDVAFPSFSIQKRILLGKAIESITVAKTTGK